MNIPQEHFPLLTKIKKFFIDQDNDEYIMPGEKEKVAKQEVFRIYQKYGYVAMRFA